MPNGFQDRGGEVPEARNAARWPGRAPGMTAVSPPGGAARGPRAMNGISRRAFVLGFAAAGGVSACGNGVGSSNARELDASVEAAKAFMYDNVTDARDLSQRAAGMLIIPLVTEASLVVGGAYGRGALQINDVTVDYYSSHKGSVGLSVGGHQYAHALFFMTENALTEFRTSNGWVAGSSIKYTTMLSGIDLGFDTTRSLTPVIGLVFGRAGLIAGLTVEGTKYTRIIP